MAIETVRVERRPLTATIRMVGKVDVDETRVSTITARMPGRLGQLFVDAAGVRVEEGERMVSLYSPELLSAQEELLQSIAALKRLPPGEKSRVRELNVATVDAVRAKLRLWGLTAGQIRQIEERGTVEEYVTITAPLAGIVLHKNAQEGMRVDTGTRIYTIADLSHVWVNLAAYESDLTWLRRGQDVTFSAEAHAGEMFQGTISFIQPVLDEATRTVRIRVAVPNETGRLKPGMFVRAVVQAEPGVEADAPLVIPASAPLLTGKQAIVYVAVPGAETPTFEGREVVLGPRAGDDYPVLEGLQEGERVVMRGAFKIDAELQIRAKPSMMTPRVRGQGAAQTHCPVMGGAINPDIYVDHNGMRIYFCCAGCEGGFLDNAEEYLSEMRAKGIEPERIEAGHEH